MTTPPANVIAHATRINVATSGWPDGLSYSLDRVVGVSASRLVSSAVSDFGISSELPDGNAYPYPS